MRPAYARRRCGAWLGVLALAAAAPVPAQAPEPWYHVEVVVFEALEPQGIDGERFPTDPGVPDDAAAIGLIEDTTLFEDELDADEAGAGEPVPESGPIAFARLAPDQHRLGGVVRRLSGSRGYRVLEHVAWRQPGFGGRRARAVRLGQPPLVEQPPAPEAPAVAPIEMPAPEVAPVEGIVRLRVGTGLHLALDLLFAAAEQPLRLTEQRPLRLGDLHYFDHPRFGALVQVSLYQPPQPEAEAEAEVGVGEQRPVRPERGP